MSTLMTDEAASFCFFHPLSVRVWSVFQCKEVVSSVGFFFLRTSVKSSHRANFRLFFPLSPNTSTILTTSSRWEICIATLRVLTLGRKFSPLWQEGVHGVVWIFFHSKDSVCEHGHGIFPGVHLKLFLLIQRERWVGGDGGRKKLCERLGNRYRTLSPD